MEVLVRLMVNILILYHGSWSHLAHDSRVEVSRSGNCRVGLYCDSQQKVCVQNRQLNQACDADKEFVSSISPLFVF
jgi:hypothetical protein